MISKVVTIKSHKGVSSYVNISKLTELEINTIRDALEQYLDSDDVDSPAIMRLFEDFDSMSSCLAGAVSFPEI